MMFTKLDANSMILSLVLFIVVGYLLLFILSNTKFVSVLIIEALVFFAILSDDLVNLVVLLLTPTIVVGILTHLVSPIVIF